MPQAPTLDLKRSERTLLIKGRWTTKKLEEEPGPKKLLHEYEL